jgi:hypothetical protein
MLVSESD